MNNEHNPPAFPVSVPGHTYGDGSSEIPHVAQEGMTLRDYFAAKALEALLFRDPGSVLNFTERPAGARLIAQEAYAVADAMLEARKQ